MKIGKKDKFVLDAYALFAYLYREKGGIVVKKILETTRSHNIKVYLNEINLGEIYYRAWKDKGRKISREFLNTCLNLPLILVHPDRDFILQAAEIKAQNNVSYADAFCIATAIIKKASLVTGDPEFLSVKDVKITWLAK